MQAVKRTSGHLYVKTADCRVAVTETVFSVNSGIKGSRVAVVQGAVHVTHGGIDKLIRAGDQLSTNENLSSEPVDQQIAWSQNREEYLVLLGQFDVLQHRIEQIPMPQLRYTSDLLPRVPADTLLYISIPNLGDFLSEAEGIFHDQLKQSAVLQQWWNAGHHVNTADLDTLVEKIHQMSQYLGDEVVIVGLKQTNNPGFAVVADVQKSGLADFLNAQFASSSSTPGFVVLDEASLAAAPISAKPQYGEYALVRPARGGLLQQHRHLEAGRRAIERGSKRICNWSVRTANLVRLRPRRRSHSRGGPSSDAAEQSQSASCGWQR